MIRRTMLTLAVSAAIVAMAGAAWAQEEVLKVGASAPKTGPLSGGAAITHWPNIQLWVHEVNAKGGIQVGDKKMKVELIEYDDKSSAEEAVKNIQRLATVDNADFIVSPYTTGLNVATAPLIARYGYPHIVTTGITDGVQEFAKRWPNSFWVLGTSTELARGMVATLVKLRNAGAIGNKVAVVNVADAFGLELAGAGKPALKAADFEIVYEASYPLGTQDVAPIISQVKAAGPHAFIGFSYPPDTFALTEQAQIQDLQVGAFYVGAGASFPAYAGKFGKVANGVLGAGGTNPDDPKIQKYRERHNEVTGADADYWASSVTYSGLQILEQAIVMAGTKDRAAVVEAIKTGTFDTVMGSISFESNVNRDLWTVGQWKDGAFHGVAVNGLEGAIEPVAKKGWE